MKKLYLSSIAEREGKGCALRLVLLFTALSSEQQICLYSILDDHFVLSYKTDKIKWSFELVWACIIE